MRQNLASMWSENSVAYSVQVVLADRPSDKVPYRLIT